MRKITDLIDQSRTEQKALVQARIPEGLREDVVIQMKLDRKLGIKVTWNSFLKAACLSYLAERGKIKRNDR